MIHLNPKRKGGYEATMPLPPDPSRESWEKGEPHLQIRVSYTLGGDSMFGGKTNSRGVYVYVTPCRIAEGMMSTTLMGSTAKSGAKILARGLQRLSAKVVTEVAEQVDPIIPQLVELWKTGQIDEVFWVLRRTVGPATPVLPVAMAAPARKSLLTAALRASIPKIRANEEVADPVVQCKFFTPDGAATWLVLEFDGDDEFYGWVTLGLGPECDELGYFSLKELESIRGKLGLPVERDRYFTPCPLSVATKQYQSAAR